MPCLATSLAPASPPSVLSLVKHAPTSATKTATAWVESATAIQATQALTVPSLPALPPFTMTPQPVPVLVPAPQAISPTNTPAVANNANLPVLSVWVLQLTV